MIKRPVIIIGAGGHARVLLDTLLSASYSVIGLTDLHPHKFNNPHLYFNIPLLGPDEMIFHYPPDSIHLINGLGMIPGPNFHHRMQIYQQFKASGYTFPAVVHPSAVIAANVEINDGVQIMAGSVIQTGAIIGDNTIVNTRVTIDHDAVIGSHVHLAPGTTISGGAIIGSHTFVGAGSTIIQGIHIAEHSTIGAGSVVIRNVPEGVTVMGVPAELFSRE
jgi:UDP-perosamine 4-acetyltransferase